MTPHTPEEWNPFVIVHNTMPPRDPEEDEEDGDEEEEEEEDEEDEAAQDRGSPPDSAALGRQPAQVRPVTLGHLHSIRIRRFGFGQTGFFLLCLIPCREDGLASSPQSPQLGHSPPPPVALAPPSGRPARTG
jgi:hypothetical protein